jgi:hypothetical protein
MTTATIPQTQYDVQQYARQGHEMQCARVPLTTRIGGGIRWFRCTGCGFTFNEYTEGAAALVRRARAKR